MSGGEPAFVRARREARTGQHEGPPCSSCGSAARMERTRLRLALVESREEVHGWKCGDCRVIVLREEQGSLAPLVGEATRGAREALMDTITEATDLSLTETPMGVMTRYEIRASLSAPVRAAEGHSSFFRLPDRRFSDGHGVHALLHSRTTEMEVNGVRYRRDATWGELLTGTVWWNGGFVLDQTDEIGFTGWREHE